MFPPIFLSTGAFTGRINDRNPNLLLQYADQLPCDGFEVMIFDSFEDDLFKIVRSYHDASISCPIVHAQKSLGDFMSCPSTSAFMRVREIFLRNCEAASILGAQKMVVHLWGRPDSDTYFKEISQRVGWLLETASEAGLDLVAENCVCFHSSLQNLECLANDYPSLGLTIDTRPAQFHRELERTMQSSVLRPHIRHIHINDYHGGLCDWSALYPILQPGTGDVDFPFFFRSLAEQSYCNGITLEAPSMLAQGVDLENLSSGLAFIREGLRTGGFQE